MTIRVITKHFNITYLDGLGMLRMMPVQVDVRDADELRLTAFSQAIFSVLESAPLWHISDLDVTSTPCNESSGGVLCLETNSLTLCVETSPLWPIAVPRTLVTDGRRDCILCAIESHFLGMLKASGRDSAGFDILLVEDEQVDSTVLARYDTQDLYPTDVFSLFVVNGNAYINEVRRMYTDNKNHPKTTYLFLGNGGLGGFRQDPSVYQAAVGSTREHMLEKVCHRMLVDGDVAYVKEG